MEYEVVGQLQAQVVGLSLRLPWRFLLRKHAKTLAGVGRHETRFPKVLFCEAMGYGHSLFGTWWPFCVTGAILPMPKLHFFAGPSTDILTKFSCATASTEILSRRSCTRSSTVTRELAESSLVSLGHIPCDTVWGRRDSQYRDDESSVSIPLYSHPPGIILSPASKNHASVSRTCRSQKVSRVWQSLVVPSVTISVQEHTGTLRTVYENHHVIGKSSN